MVMNSRLRTPNNWRGPAIALEAVLAERLQLIWLGGDLNHRPLGYEAITTSILNNLQARVAPQNLVRKRLRFLIGQ
jgi:hypothetical protein